MNSYKLHLEQQCREAGLRLADDGPPVISVHDLPATAYTGQTARDPWEQSFYDGGKFIGGFGTTQVQAVDYWTLRARSAQLFNENLYAKGLVRRLVTNEINTGLTPESCPDEQVLGLPDDSLADWTEITENRFGLWGKSPQVCDWKKEKTFGALQREIRQEALINGDVLVVLRPNAITGTPAVQLISGNNVQTPFMGDAKIRQGNEVTHGVETDPAGRVVAYWIRQKDLSFRRLPAYGEKSGRRLAWLVFGTERRLDDLRGQPLLAVVLQSLKEIDRYRDSAQRKAVINSLLAMVVTKNNDKPGTLPLAGGAVKRDQATTTNATGAPRQFNLSKYVPGMVIDELQLGEDIQLKGGEGTDINFPAFEEAMICAIAWACQIPPEILRLAFSNNYSASQAAINEFKIYLNLVWGDFGEAVCSPIYTEWLIAENRQGKNTAPGLLEAWRDPRKHDILAAWVSVEWYGSIKPSTDMVKQAKGSKLLVDECWSTNARETRNLTGMKHSKVVKRVARENRAKAEAMRPLLELQAEFGPQATDATAEATASAIMELVTDGMENQDYG